jgi:glyoxylase-like metal-dependent hydrolase (beta-lactamase superfamily II)
MRRALVLGVLLAVGVLTAVKAQQPPAQGPKTLEVDKLRDNLYVLKGGGGNTAVFITADGVTVVDAKNPGWGQPILDKIKELTPKPVTRLINTHTHGDHVSGNVEFPATVDVVVQDNTKVNMEKMDIFKQSNGRGLPAHTFKEKMTIGKGADQIDLYYFGPGHTDGDAVVVFPTLKTAHIGDLFAGKGLPLVDGNNGGSVLHYPETLNNAYNGIKNVDTIINGHMPTTTTWADLKTFAEFNQDFLTWAQDELKAGKSPKDAAPEWKVPAKYEAAGYSVTVSTTFGGIEGRLQRLADETKK